MEKKQVTIKEIARQLNISVSAVSKALHNDPSIGLKTKNRVLELAKQLNYEPNQTAIFLQKGRTQTIGVVVPDLVETFFPAVIKGIEEVAIANDYVVLLGQSLEDPEREKRLLESMKKHRVDGLLLSVSKNTTQLEYLKKLKEDIPLVFFDRIPELSEIHYVACNLVSGTAQAVKFLHRNKHRVIGMVNGPEKFVASKDRLEGYRLGLDKVRLKYDPSLVINCDLSVEGIRQATFDLLYHKRNVTAIVAFHDNAAIEVIQYLQAIGKVEEISVVSFANLPMAAHSIYRPAASVEQYPYLQGQKATTMLLEIIDEKKNSFGTKTTYYKIILDSNLVVFKND